MNCWKPNKEVVVEVITYNQEQYVDSLVKGFLDQTYPYLEMEVWDDCSTDNTYEEYSKKSFPETTNHIFTTTSAVNNGSNYNFDRSIASAIEKGYEYIALMDGDDYYYPTKLWESIEFMETKGYDMVCTDIDALWPAGERMPHDFWVRRGWHSMFGPLPEHFTFDYLVQDNRIYTSTVVAKREVFLEAPTMMEFKERGYGMLGDYPLFLWIAKRFKIGYLNKALTVKRELKNSLIHRTDLYAEMVRIYAKIKQDARAGLI